ncbi:hypothetical protein [Microbacterium invictum]|uniref:Secreted protein n=1 Tax=Microbacterium invictum TaxID=515415 RepID=A0ABZ0VEB9_9MICO|nr:hypothetical protein [Microbacterium invictum]WQB71789.1 hypothetical protein T9R20_07520 [Microbacterium invictum]
MIKKRRTTGLLSIAASVGIALGLLVPATAAHAGPWGPVVQVFCPSGQIAQVKFTVTGSRAIVGYGRTSSQASAGNYIYVDPGQTRYINLGANIGYYQKWNDPGSEVLSATKMCVGWS